MIAATTLHEDVAIPAGRVALRRYAARHAPAIAAEIGHPEVARNLARVPLPYRLADAESFIAATLSGERDEVVFAIERDGALIGGIGLMHPFAERELGYWLGRAHWGKGVMTEAAEAFLGFVFGRFGRGRVTSGVFADNPASLRVQEKLGFEVVGRRRVRSLARGEDVDHIDTVLTFERFAGGPR